MAAEQERGLVVAKASTGPFQSAKVSRDAITKSRPTPKKELDKRSVRAKQPPRKSQSAPAQNPQPAEKSLAGLEERKKEQPNPHAAAKSDDIEGSDEQKQEKAEFEAQLHAHRLYVHEMRGACGPTVTPKWGKPRGGKGV